MDYTNGLNVLVKYNNMVVPLSKNTTPQNMTTIRIPIKYLSQAAICESRMRRWVYVERENTNENDTNTRPSITIRPILYNPMCLAF